ncbi:MAG: hypothetical protein HY645_11695 [Acidobacteria bacterium]|nr:hypothetical protein [Acidobacteriota bacterium]
MLLSSSKSLTGHPKRSLVPSRLLWIPVLALAACAGTVEMTVELEGFQKNQATVFVTTTDASNPQTLFAQSNLWTNRLRFAVDRRRYGPSIRVHLNAGGQSEEEVVVFKPFRRSYRLTFRARRSSGE